MNSCQLARRLGHFAAWGMNATATASVATSVATSATSVTAPASVVLSTNSLFWCLVGALVFSGMPSSPAQFPDPHHSHPHRPATTITEKLRPSLSSSSESRIIITIMVIIFLRIYRSSFIMIMIAMVMDMFTIMTRGQC